jgi:hypothetical protein
MGFAKGFAVLCVIGFASSFNVSADEADPCDAAYKAGKARFTVVSDANCKLSVNDQPQGTLAANQEKAVTVAGGKQVIKCASTEVAGAVARDEQQVEAGCGSASFEVASFWHRFAAQKNGTVKDAETGLTWLQSDNGADIDWKGAQQFCAGKGGRLPTKDELKALHSAGKNSAPCGEYPCMVSNLFRLTSRFLWSSTTFGESDAIAVGLAGAGPAAQSVKQTNVSGTRALCVAAK